MLIPIGTDRPLRRPPLVTPVLIGVNIAIFLCQAILEKSDPVAYQRLLEPLLISGAGFRAWQLVTYAFLHAGWWHLLGNMLVLWVFGPNVEDRLTRGGFIAFYLVGAAISGGTHALLQDNPALGASGAISAITGAYIVLFPRTNIRCVLFIIIIGIFNIPAWIFIVFAIGKDLVFVTAANDNVARFAHLGGYAYGIIVSLFLLWRHLLSREPYDLFTIGRQAYRRRQLKDASVSRARVEATTGVRRVGPDGNIDDSAAAKARANVAALLAGHDLEGAAAAYKQLVESHADTPAMCTLSRRQQLDLANHFFSTGDHEAAVYAYQRFLDAYGRDSEAPRVRLMLGLINTRYLNDPVRARQLLTGLAPILRDADQKLLAESLLKEIG
jgi:membrane associated rhomboid family serine protease